MSDISFLVFQDERGFYRLEGEDPDNQVRIDMTKEEAHAWIDAQSGRYEETYRDFLIAEAEGGPIPVRMPQEPTMHFCRFCGQYHPVASIEFYCPLDPQK